MREIIDHMFEGLAAGPEVYQPSKFWQQLNEANVAELERTGIGEIKQTLAQNYFTWVVGFRSPLFRQLRRVIGARNWPMVLKGLPRFRRSDGLSFRRFYENQIFTRLVWLLAERHDRLSLLKSLKEPAFGKPFDIRFNGRLISQDLANSVIEYYAITEARRPEHGEPFSVCEIGAGYGRNAYVFLSLHERCKYIIVDIPPALYVSQEYLTRVFPEKKAFLYREITDWEKEFSEFEQSDIVFLLPHQASMLKNKSVQYFINISSFHEMTFEQVSTYFDIIDSLTSGYFFLKQWLSFDNVNDKMVIKKADYPVKPTWQRVYERVPESHPQFFEALYKIG